MIWNYDQWGVKSLHFFKVIWKNMHACFVWSPGDEENISGCLFISSFTSNPTAWLYFLSCLSVSLYPCHLSLCTPAGRDKQNIQSYVNSQLFDSLLLSYNPPQSYLMKKDICTRYFVHSLHSGCCNVCNMCKLDKLNTHTYI